MKRYPTHPDLKRTTASPGEAALAFHLHATKLPAPEREYRFAPPRQWRFDFAFPDRRVAVEVEGGVHTGGRHTRGAGFEADCKKLNEATRLGWRVFRFTTAMVESGEALALLEEVLR